MGQVRLSKLNNVELHIRGPEITEVTEMLSEFKDLNITTNWNA